MSRAPAARRRAARVHGAGAGAAGGAGARVVRLRELAAGAAADRARAAQRGVLGVAVRPAAALLARRGQRCGPAARGHRAGGRRAAAARANRASWSSARTRTAARQGTERRMDPRWGQQEQLLRRCVPPIAGSATKREICSSRASKSWARARRREPAWASTEAGAWRGAADSECHESPATQSLHSNTLRFALSAPQPQRDQRQLLITLSERMQHNKQQGKTATHTSDSDL